MPSQSRLLVSELSGFLGTHSGIGWALLGTMIFFSSLAFSAMNKAMSVIFAHRAASHRRRFLVSALLPYLFAIVLGLGLLAVAILATGLQVIGQETFLAWGHSWSLSGISGALLYLLGFACETAFLTSIYWVMPAGGLPLRRALIGGLTAAILWELIRHLLVWYLTTLSQARAIPDRQDAAGGSRTSPVRTRSNGSRAGTARPSRSRSYARRSPCRRAAR